MGCSCDEMASQEVAGFWLIFVCLLALIYVNIKRVVNFLDLGRHV